MRESAAHGEAMRFPSVAWRPQTLTGNWQGPLASAMRRVLGRGQQADHVVDECMAIASAAAAPLAAREAAAEFWSLVLLALSVVAATVYYFCFSKSATGDEDEDGDVHKPAELLALFSNPALPKEAARFGLRPLAFGQDLKLLLHALPPTDIDVEPAATLLSAQQALLRSSPRFLLFSGHTILEALAFESEDGRLDLHADPSFFVTLLETLNVEHETARATTTTTTTTTRATSDAPQSDSPARSAVAPPPPGAPPLKRENATAAATAAASGTRWPKPSAAPSAVHAGNGRGGSSSSSGTEPPVARVSSASRAVAAPLAERAVTLFAHLDELKVSAAEKIQRYARGQIIRAQSRSLYDQVLSTRAGARAGAGAEGRARRRSSTAREVSALVERFRERLGVEPPLRPRAEALARLRCVVLNGCQTDEIGRQLVRALPRLAVVCWSSVAEDSAARAFAVGFYAAIAEGLHARARYRRRMRRVWPRLLSLLLPERLAQSVLGGDPEAAEDAESAEGGGGAHESAYRAFEAGCYAFLSAGFRFGDPADWLHPPGHAHSFRPCLTGKCDGCTPPVHGSILLLTVDPCTGEIVERRGDEHAISHGGSSFSRLLAWQRRSRVKALQANEAVPTRSPAWQVAGAVTAAMRTPKPSERSERLSRWTAPKAAEAERASVRATLTEGDFGDQVDVAFAAQPP